MGARESSNLEMPMNTDKERPKKSPLSVAERGNSKTENF